MGQNLNFIRQFLPRPVRSACRRCLTWARLKRLPAPQREIVENVRRRARELENNSGMFPVVGLWEQQIKSIRGHLMWEELSRFLSWPPILSTMIYCPGVEVFHRMKLSPYWNRFSEALKEVPAGGPQRYEPWPETSGNLLHQGHHLMRLAEHLGGLGTFTSVQQVIEFGGGYGCMCQLWFRLGFRGNYLIYDLPELSILQEYFLSSCGLGVTVGHDAPASLPSVTLCRTMDVVDARLKTISRKDFIFIGMWSISEAPVALREKLLPVMNQAKAVLLGFQEKFEGIDNSAFFQQMQLECPALDWVVEDYPGLPGNHYLIGKRRS